MKLIDNFLNNITMYRLVLYFLIILAIVGLLYSFFGVLPFDPFAFVFSFTFLLFVSWVANYVFSKVYEAPTNVESVWISGLILGLIIAPPKSLHDVIFLGWAATLTMASKYILAIGKKHIFNPVAISVAITAFAIGGTANWWVGSSSMLAFVVIGGFLIARKLRRWDLVLSFIISALLVVGPNRILKSVLDSPLIFFAVIMITEPLTTPPTRYLRIIYGVFVGLLFAPQVHLGTIFSTPELALVAGNILSYIVSPKYKLLLKLKERVKLTDDTYDFVFDIDSPIKFTPGQYMEFTFDHANPDTRGNRRYLSLASSPTESNVRLGVKFGVPPSSYKQNLITMQTDQKIVASQLIGDFIMPKDYTKKLVFIAGGIGITPYRSMIKYLIDKNEKRDIVVIYTAKTEQEFVYKDILNEAVSKLGIKVFYVDTATKGHADANFISTSIPDFSERTFYISGSHGVVVAFEDALKSLNVKKSQVVTDYFPGFA